MTMEEEDLEKVKMTVISICQLPACRENQKETRVLLISLHFEENRLKVVRDETDALVGILFIFQIAIFL